MRWCIRCLKVGPVRDCRDCDRQGRDNREGDIVLEPVEQKRVRPRIVVAPAAE